MSARALRRRRSREILLQALYEARIGRAQTGTDRLGGLDPIRQSFGQDDGDDEDTEYSARLRGQLIDRASEIDELVGASARNWRMERMDAVDLSVIRLATAELLLSEAPAGAVVNEAVELAKRFGSERSGAFVNGVVDGVRRNLADRRP